MNKHFFIQIFFIFYITSHILWGDSIDIQQNNISLLEHSDVYEDTNNSSLSALIVSKVFSPYPKKFVNMGKKRDAVWIKMTFDNNSTQVVNRILLIKGYGIEHIFLYRSATESPELRGLTYPNRVQNTLFPYFNISLSPKTEQTYYLKLYGEYLPVSFDLFLEKEEAYHKQDKKDQLLYFLALGILIAFMLYGVIHTIYIRDIDYLFYSIYLFLLLSALLQNLGFFQLYVSIEIVSFLLKNALVLLYIIILAMILFASTFLKIQAYSKIYYTYIVLTFLTFFGFLFKSTPTEESITMVTMLNFFVLCFNIAVGIYLYRKGKKVARFYLLGFGMVFLSYMLVMSNALGFFEMTTHTAYSMMLWTTILEALFLYLAFSDRYVIVQKEKQNLAQRLLREAEARTTLIEQEVKRKTLELNKALETKEVLLQEVHHRVKNNLSIILSIIQMQEEAFSDEEIKNAFINLENRINALAKSYEMLIVGSSLNTIDMRPYLEALLIDIQKSLFIESKQIFIESKINVQLPLEKAVYIGLIVNELITNAYKHAFEEGGRIFLELKEQEGYCTLSISDTGKGFDSLKVKKSLGLNLIEVLVAKKLKGKIEYHLNQGASFIITFSL